MNPQDFDALLSTQSGFYSQTQMVNSDANHRLTQQALQNVQAMQTAVPLGNVPGVPVSPAFEQMAQERKALEAQFHVLLNGAQKGPLTLEQLKGLAIADVIDENTQVWRVGTKDWTDLKTCLNNL